MQLDSPGEPLREVSSTVPEPDGHDLLIEVAACGVCLTDLHIVDGEIHGMLPIVPGHEIVGRVVALGPLARGFAINDRLGVPWLGGTDGSCFYCLHEQENLCDHPTFTGFGRNGGYATHVLADSRFCLRIPDRFEDAQAAPLLCAGLIGYRSLKIAGNGARIGLMALGQPRTSLRRSRYGRAAASSPSPDPVIRQASNSRVLSVAAGPEARTRHRPRSSTRRSSSRRSDRLFPKP